MKWLPLALAGAVGLTVGAGVTIWLQDEPDEPATTLAAAPVTTAAAPAPAPDDRRLLVWTAGGLPPGFADGVRAIPGVVSATVVLGDLAGLTATYDTEGRVVDQTGTGFVIPLDALAIDPTTYPTFFDKGAQAELQALRPGEALLGESSAALRRIGPGGAIELSNGTRLTVGGVVDDAVVGAAEVVVSTDTAAAAGISTERFMLLQYDGSKAEVDQAITALAPGVTVRFRTDEETPYLRHADAVLPQVFIKEQFGEFSYTENVDGDITVDPAWEAEHITLATVPIIGELGPCHRAIIPRIEAAMRQLEQDNLAYLVDAAGYRGCYVPSLIPLGRTRGEPSSGPSRHSWGVALDLNFSQSPTGVTSAVDPRLVAVMEQQGFRSGEEWLIPDPGHFEFYVPPGR